jgi:L-asparaginase II
MGSSCNGKFAGVLVTCEQDDLALEGCLLENLDDLGSSFVINMYERVITQNWQRDTTLRVVCLHKCKT